MKPPPEAPTLFLDRNLGKNIISARLRSEGVNVEVHDDHFAIDAPDEEWIRSVATTPAPFVAAITSNGALRKIWPRDAGHEEDA